MKALLDYISVRDLVHGVAGSIIAALVLAYWRTSVLKLFRSMITLGKLAYRVSCWLTTTLVGFLIVVVVGFLVGFIPACLPGVLIGVLHGVVADPYMGLLAFARGLLGFASLFGVLSSLLWVAALLVGDLPAVTELGKDTIYYLWRLVRWKGGTGSLGASPSIP